MTETPDPDRVATWRQAVATAYAPKVPQGPEWRDDVRALWPAAAAKYAPLADIPPEPASLAHTTTVRPRSPLHLTTPIAIESMAVVAEVEQNLASAIELASRVRPDIVADGRYTPQHRERLVVERAESIIATLVPTAQRVAGIVHLTQNIERQVAETRLAHDRGLSPAGAIRDGHVRDALLGMSLAERNGLIVEALTARDVDVLGAIARWPAVLDKGTGQVSGSILALTDRPSIERRLGQLLAPLLSQALAEVRGIAEVAASVLNRALAEIQRHTGASSFSSPTLNGLRSHVASFDRWASSRHVHNAVEVDRAHRAQLQEV